MLRLEPSHAPVNIPLFLWETIFNCTCLRVYSDASPLSATVIEEVGHRVPIVLYNPTHKPSFYLPCNILSVSENVSTFQPPEYLSFINILITAEHSNYTSSLQRYTRKIFFWITAIASHPIIRYFDENGDLEVITENTFREITHQLLSRSLKLPNFKGKEFLITVANHTVYSLTGANKLNGTEWTSGIEYDTIEFVCGLLNLTKIILPADEIGNLESGNATGIIADVINDRTDVAIGGIWLNAEMSSAVEYFQPYDCSCGRYLIPRPSHVVKESNLILLPFEESLWISVSAAVFIGSGMKTLFARFVDDGFSRRYRSFKWSLYATIMQLILRYYPNEVENRGVMRPLFVSWSWLSFMLVTLYSSQLAAILVNPHYEEKPQTIVDFYKKGYYWGGPTTAHHLYQVIVSPIYSPLWRNERFLREDSVDDRNARMEKGAYAVRGESTGDYFYFKDDHMPREDIVKNYEAAGTCFAVFYTSPIFPRGSPYSELFNRLLFLMRASGIKIKRKKDLFSKKPIRDFIPRNVFSFTTSNKTKEFVPVNLSLVSYPFILLLVGHCTAILIFLGNHLYRKGTRIQLKMLAIRRHNVKLIKVKRFSYNE